MFPRSAFPLFIIQWPPTPPTVHGVMTSYCFRSVNSFHSSGQWPKIVPQVKSPPATLQLSDLLMCSSHRASSVFQVSDLKTVRQVRSPPAILQLSDLLMCSSHWAPSVLQVRDLTSWSSSVLEVINLLLKSNSQWPPDVSNLRSVLTWPCAAVSFSCDHVTV